MVGHAKARILALAAKQGSLANRDVAGALGISRQAALRHLQALVARGDLVAEGAGRGARYRRPQTSRVPAAALGDGRAGRHFRYATQGLEEDQVWKDLRGRVPALAALAGDAAGVFQYVLTELVNNAIDHSGAPEVEVVLTGSAEETLTIEVLDGGVGAFAHVRQYLGLASDLEAIQELSKGKVTTLPARHSGEGLFFASKAGDRFEVESGGLRWVVDNLREDMAIGTVDPPRKGTRVCFSARPAAVPSLRALFDEYTEDFAFTRTRTIVKLFEIGVTFVSRSEAKRLLHGLEKFREVILDFAHVDQVGQGFADEVFRVWAADHPEVRVLPVHMNEAVAFMVERARRAGTG